ncbi:phosphoribosylglycinamide formyltransferase [Polaribacter reichenbachii]|uniref:phosphoribosylglycinamide formyltransferase 1 n=1 Tax=Polaribacter reichenbachii TaxID=996801 RepID=A0A1B8TYF5_9FLAO|nr:phosphoribosylglycinamide formyltransferase [Polaribacter reichenbachii]APZ45817.1 phosphoribosylglycinamide formyltransferase [Polaribacter reichenbachii]AUC19679.1 phosphoribosylglycinamide formyltransferase [Polaribacter reichenbachii]OBY64751.1 phosphoribosylglycinamide formyltransferase [Polaribacter reichenbachii]
MKRIVVFASGSGTNAENIIKFFNHTKTAKVTKVLCNNERAKVFERCKILNTNSLHFKKEEFFSSDYILNILKEEADFIVLAGFLWKIPEKIIDAFPEKIINIHPALLPNYGGKGMYGMNVHKAVAANKETETGITIHYVNANYDEGAIIFQAKTALNDTDTPETIAEKIHILEQKYFPKVIEEVILSTNA